MGGKLAIDGTPRNAADEADLYRPLSDTLCAVAGEISDLAQLSDRLQSLISAALLADGSANPDHVREFQAIDLLVQRLHGVADFLGALAKVSGADWTVDAAAAAARVPLSDLARRLSGEAIPPGSTDQTWRTSMGDLDLFG